MNEEVLRQILLGEIDYLMEITDEEMMLDEIEYLMTLTPAVSCYEQVQRQFACPN